MSLIKIKAKNDASVMSATQRDVFKLSRIELMRVSDLVLKFHLMAIRKIKIKNFNKKGEIQINKKNINHYFQLN